MADLNVALILRLVDRLTAPARGAVRSVVSVGQSMTGTMRSATGLNYAVRTTETRVGALTRPTQTAASALAGLQEQNRRVREGAFLTSEALNRETGAARRFADAARAATTAGGGLAGVQQWIATTADRAGVAVAGVSAAAGRIGRGAGQIGQSGGRLAMTAGLTAGALAGTTNLLLGPAREYETQFNRLLTAFRGDAAAARREMTWISEFARTTPYERTEVTDATSRLRGRSADPHRAIRSIGNATAGEGMALQQGVDAFNDALVGENERLKEFNIVARRAGDNVTYLYQAADGAERAITVAANNRRAIETALLGIFDQRYAGGMERQSQSFNGMLSNLSDGWSGFRLRVMQDGGVFDWLRGRLGGFLARIDRMAADGSLDRLARNFGRDLTRTLDQAFAAADRVWTLARQVVRAVQPLADAVGGWPNLILIAAGLRIFAAGLGMVGGAFTMLRGVGSGVVAIARFAGLDRAGAAALRWARTQALAARLAIALNGGVLASGRMLVVGLLTGFRMLAVGLLTNPVGLIIAAIVAAIAVGAVLIIRNWSRVSAFFRGVFAGVSGALSPLWRELQALGREVAPLLAPLGGVFRAIGDGIGAAWRWVMRLFNPVQATAEELRGATSAGVSFGRGVGEAISFLVRPLVWAARGAAALAGVVVRNWGSITGFLGTLWRGVTTIVSSAWAVLRFLFAWSPLGLLARHWGPIRAFVGGVLSSVASAALSAGRGLQLAIAFIAGAWRIVLARWADVTIRFRVFWAAVRAHFVSGVAGVVQSVVSGWGRATDFLQSLPARFQQFGRDMLAGLARGILSGVDAAVEAARNAASRLTNIVRSVLGIRSPSRVFAAIGRDTIAGLTQGIAANENTPVRRAASLARRVAAAAAPTLPLLAADEGTPVRRAASPARRLAAAASAALATPAANENAPIRRAASLASRVAAAAAAALALPAAAAPPPGSPEPGPARPGIVLSGTSQAPPPGPFGEGGGGRPPVAPMTIGSLTIQVRVQAAAGADARAQGAQAGQAAAESLRTALFDLRAD